MIKSGRMDRHEMQEIFKDGNAAWDKENRMKYKVGNFEKQIMRLKEEISVQASKQALVISMAAMTDELKLTDEQVRNVVKRIGRYAGYLEDYRI